MQNTVLVRRGGGLEGELEGGQIRAHTKVTPSNALIKSLK